MLLCGVLGNISDADAERLVRSMPQFCRPDATVIWTRSRRSPDRTPQIRRWFTESSFTELAFIAPADVMFSVGAARFDGIPSDLDHHLLFCFVR